MPYFSPAAAASVSGFSGVNNQTANYTAALSDASQLINLNSSSAITLTIPPNGSVAFPVGTVLNFMQGGSGALSIVAGSGVTINKLSTLVAVGQYAMGGLAQTAANIWTLYGAVQ